MSFFKSTQSKFWWFWRHHYLKSVSQGTVNIFLVCVTRLCFTSHESVVRLGRGHSFDESTSRLFLLLSFKDNICSVAVFRKLHQIDWIKQFICSLCTIGRFERDETIKVAFQGHVGFVNRHVVAYTSLKYEAWRVIWIFQITQTGIQQGDKLKSVCVYIFRSWIFDGGRVTTPNQLSSFIVGILSPTKLNLKIVLLVISHHTMLF